MRVVIVGAGGHGQVVCDALLAAAGSQDTTIVGFVDDRHGLHGSQVLGLPVLGAIDQLPAILHDRIVIAVGDNRRRQELFTTLSARGERFCTVVHPRAIVAADVLIGDGTMIVGGVVVNTGSRIGANTILNTGCTVDHHNMIGDHVHVAPGVHLGGEVGVGDGTLLGIGSTVLPGRKIGAWSVVAAGSVVRRDVHAHTTVAGVPARPLRSRTIGSTRS